MAGAAEITAVALGSTLVGYVSARISGQAYDHLTMEQIEQMSSDIYQAARSIYDGAMHPGAGDSAGPPIYQFNGYSHGDSGGD